MLTRDNAPIDWANAQSGLGMCLLNLSNFGNQPDLLPEAMAAFEASKQVFTRETLPLQWAFAENNIGDVHWSRATAAAARRNTRRRSSASRAPSRRSPKPATSR